MSDQSSVSMDVPDGVAGAVAGIAMTQDAVHAAMAQHDAEAQSEAMAAPAAGSALDQRLARIEATLRQLADAMGMTPEQMLGLAGTSGTVIGRVEAVEHTLSLLPHPIALEKRLLTVEGAIAQMHPVEAVQTLFSKVGSLEARIASAFGRKGI